MRSKEFKHKTLVGLIQFKSGFTIDCHLTIKRELDENGMEKITAYIVKAVNHYYVNNEPVIEMREGQKQKRKENMELMDSLQIPLFKDEDF